jgi:methionyl-tRNA formyltransferase
MSKASLDRIVFFGTPEFAIPTLDALVQAGRRPVLVVTQPSRPVGRRRVLQDPPVAEWARRQEIEVIQPERVRSAEFLARLGEREPDIGVVVAFGQIFPSALLELPAAGCVNVHASLLPRHRGAAPVQAAIAAGDAVTGVTTMQMEVGLDSGPLLLQHELPIGGNETGGELAERLSRCGGELLVETLVRLERGDLEASPQDDALATYAPRLSRADGRIDWSHGSARIARRVRAFDPWPASFTEVRGETVKVHRVEATLETTDRAPGSILGVEGEELLVASGGGSVSGLSRLQRAGRRRVSGRELADGMRLSTEDRFE